MKRTEEIHLYLLCFMNICLKKLKQMETKKNAGKRNWALGFIILGWVFSGYLLVRSMQLNGGGTAPDLCKLIFGYSCDKVLSIPISWHFGYPLAGWGMAYFGLIGLSLSFNKIKIDHIVVLFISFGLGFSIIQSAIIIKGGLPCPLCLIIHFINLIAFITLLLAVKMPLFNQVQKRFTNRRSFVWSSMFLLFILILGSITEVGALKASIGKTTEGNMTEISKSFQKETFYNIPKNESSPHLGSLNAPIQLVVFSSFQCPACKSFAPTVENIQKKFGENIGITFKNFPLSSTCNPMVSEDMQPEACSAAFAALAAQNQNQFWNYHDQLFRTNLDEDKKILTSIAKNSGLNIEKWESDRQSVAVKEQLLEDIKIANELGINATPTVFINGRRVNSFQESVLTFLIQNELHKMSK